MQGIQFLPTSPAGFNHRCYSKVDIVPDQKDKTGRLEVEYITEEISSCVPCNKFNFMMVSGESTSRCYIFGRADLSSHRANRNKHITLE